MRERNSIFLGGKGEEETSPAVSCSSGRPASQGTIHIGRSQHFKDFGPSPPFVTHSRNLSVLFVRKIGQLLNPPSPLERDVI